MPSDVIRQLAFTAYVLQDEEKITKAAELVKKLPLQSKDYRQIEEMLRFKRSKLRSELLALLMRQEDRDMEECLRRLLADKRENKRSAGLDLLLRLSKQERKADFYGRVRTLAAGIDNPTDKEKVLMGEILGEQTAAASEQRGFGIYDPDAPEEIPGIKEGRDVILRCLPLSEKDIILKMKKLDALFQENKNMNMIRCSVIRGCWAMPMCG